jgi:hypothetical protein
MYSSKNSLSPNKKKSLNLSIRSKHQRKILGENIEIVKRLHNMKSIYDLKPHQKSPSDIRQYNNSEFIHDYPQYQESKNLYRPRKLSPLVIEVKKLVYKQNVFLDNRLFSIEITKGDHAVRIVANDENTEETFSLELGRPEAMVMMGGAEDWERIVKCLHLEGNDLALWQEDINYIKN